MNKDSFDKKQDRAKLLHNKHMLPIYNKKLKADYNDEEKCNRFLTCIFIFLSLLVFCIFVIINENSKNDTKNNVTD